MISHYIERKKHTGGNRTENQHISVSRFIPDLGVKFYKLTVEQGLEGIVAKQKDSKYIF
jgi:ATP-dependent DNA ligase